MKIAYFCAIIFNAGQVNLQPAGIIHKRCKSERQPQGLNVCLHMYSNLGRVNN